MRYLFIIFLFFPLTANACTLDKDVLLEKKSHGNLTTNCPKKVSNFAERVSECIHWGGEFAEGDSKEARERRKFIAKAVDRLKCINADVNYIKNDGEKMLKEYSKSNLSNKQEILNVLKEILDGWAN